MGIQIYGNSGYNYNHMYSRMNVNGVASVKEEEATASGQLNSEVNIDNSAVQAADREVMWTPRHSDPVDFTFDFKKNNSYNLVGATNAQEDMDVDKAMSEMRKDSVLDQYKYFVKPGNLGTDEDGTVSLIKG